MDKTREDLEAEVAELRAENQSLRSRTTRGEATRERIWSTAIEVLSTIGWEADLKHFTSAAGIGTTTFYRHFDGRDDLVRAVAVAMVAEVSARAEELMKLQDGREIFFHWSHTGFAMVRKYGKLAVQACFPEDIPSYLADIFKNDETYRFTGWIINRCKAQGHCRTDASTRSMVRTFFSLVHPHRVRWCEREGLSDEEIFQETMQVFLLAYATPETLAAMAEKMRG